MSRKATVSVIAALVAFLFSACGGRQVPAVDMLNEISYGWHYRNLDSTRYYAERALSLSKNYPDGEAEALNNLAFVSLAKMHYREAQRQLEQVFEKTDNQVELLIADIQLMRLCQRESRNKDFYDYRERAARRLVRIEEEPDALNEHLQRRLAYASSEFRIVAATYFYYVGLSGQSVNAIEEINPDGAIQQDTAQLLSYWYNVGSGGIILNGQPEDIAQTEFDYLIRCYLMARQCDYPYWEAQAMQAISEHLQQPRQRQRLLTDNLPAMKFLNTDFMPDSLLAGNLAQRALDIFSHYGDVYQTAGANRTLAECYWQIHDYSSALICLNRALERDTAINQAPDLVASIREQLCLVYSAVDDKINSDRNRNIYLDLQEQTRQDRYLESRASQLDRSMRQLNIMLIAVIFMIVLVLVLLFLFDRMRHRSDAQFSLDTLLEPLRQWQNHNEQLNEQEQTHYEELEEQMGVERLHLQQNKRRNLEQRAKIQLVNSVMPFIDRMVNEVSRLKSGKDTETVRKQRYEYIAELTDSINDYNNVLTQWIQMRQGDVSLKIESFNLQSLFDVVKHSRMGFKLKGINLDVVPTQATVKADKTLTLFMINTIADNARKFTPAGGTVTVSAHEGDDYVEVNVKDTGCGMTEEQLSHVFDRTYTGGHGFGLKNCNGIIEKYKKISRIFSVCAIGAKSVVGKGTSISFRLPKGVLRMLVWAMLTLTCWATSGSALAAVPAGAQAVSPDSIKAAQFADSAYFANINGNYRRTLDFSDSCQKYLSRRDTAIILDISNETAVAALALHKWDLYHKFNKVYTRLFREASSDNSLPEYVRTMQRSENNKVVAIILLVVLLIIIFPAYYFLYYRHVLNYRFCIERIKAMNQLLLEDVTDEEKLKGINRLDDFSKFDLTSEQKRNLEDIVKKIREALQISIHHSSSWSTSMELADDELRRLQLETDRLHVSNSVLDNCLSTLKHETMYYPSRIRQLIDGSDDNLEGLAELTSYYQELYTILSRQAMRQIGAIHLDSDMTLYLFDLLKRLNRGVRPAITLMSTNEQYASVRVDMTGLILSTEQCRNLFTPYTTDLDFLLCRQIVREMGEATNLRASGMESESTAEGVTIKIKMPIVCWRQMTQSNDK